MFKDYAHQFILKVAEHIKLLCLLLQGPGFGRYLWNLHLLPVKAFGFLQMLLFPRAFQRRVDVCVNWPLQIAPIVYCVHLCGVDGNGARIN